MEKKIKVCGMRNSYNIKELLLLEPEFVGFILFPGSKRYVGDNYQFDVDFSATTKKVGVFVNALLKDVVKRKVQLGLDYVQLHGYESPEYCNEIKAMGLSIIKAFGVQPGFDFNILTDYVPYCDYFLFDTKTPIHGGSGEKFDWEILNDYYVNKPFFLSGGIKPEDAIILSKLQLNNLYAFDINSGFETAPALKDIGLVKDFIKTIRSK